MRELPIYNGQNEKQIIEELANQWDELLIELEELPNRYLTGRKVNKVPSAYTDVVAGVDRENDFNWDAATGGFYVVVDNAGTLEWWVATLARA